MSTLVLSNFDYSALPADVATDAQAAAARIRECHRASIFEIGRELQAIKNKLGHGHFLDWIRAEFGMTDRTARNYMQAAATLYDKSETVSHLPASAIYELSSPKAATIREEVIERLEAGEYVGPAAIQQRFLEARAAERSAKISDKRRKAMQRTELAAQRRRERERQEWQAEQAARTEARREAARMISDALGDDLPTLIALLKVCGSVGASDIEGVASPASPSWQPSMAGAA